MPVLKHAKKKLRQDKNRTLKNRKVRELYKDLVKKARVSPTKANLSAAFSSIDKAAKENIIHENKAARLKASLTKLDTKSDAKSDGKVKAAPAKVEEKPAVKKEAVSKTTKKVATKKATKKSSKK